MKTNKKLPVKKAKALLCAKQAAGTLAKVVLMMEENRYCPEIIQQVESVIGLMKTNKREILTRQQDTGLEYKL